MDLIIHADDYGVSQKQAADIRDCARNGCLNSASLMLNSPMLPETTRSLLDELPEVRIAMHINLVEGRCMANPAEVPALVDERGCFRLSFETLLIRSLLPGRGRLKRQIQTEIAAQIARARAMLPAGRALRLDSHQHFHAIPLVFSALMDVVEAEALPVEYIRRPAEPLLPFWETPDVLPRVRPINYIKVFLLKFLLLFSRRRFGKTGVKSAVFCGVALTGDMNARDVSRLLPAMARYAKKHGDALELLFHPGMLNNAEECLDREKERFVAFNLSPKRRVEFDALHALPDTIQRMRGEGLLS